MEKIQILWAKAPQLANDGSKKENIQETLEVNGRDTLCEMRELGRLSNSKRFETIKKVLNNSNEEVNQNGERISYATAKKIKEHNLEVKQKVEKKLNSAKKRPDLVEKIKTDVMANYEEVKKNNDKLVNDGLGNQEEKLRRQLDDRMNKSFNKSLSK